VPAPSEARIKNLTGEDLSENNPIDSFFYEHELSDSSSFAIRRYIYLYMGLWKAEMDHAYNELIRAGH
jgi:hypothetical protein